MIGWQKDRCETVLCLYFLPVSALSQKKQTLGRSLGIPALALKSDINGRVA